MNVEIDNSSNAPITSDISGSEEARNTNPVSIIKQQFFGLEKLFCLQNCLQTSF